MIGSVIDKYEVLQKLGEGATATVYRGRHLSIGKDVAIKVLHPHLCTSARYRERFHREARAVGRLSHDNIVSILDYSGHGTDDCYIVTELVDGLTLLQLIEEHGRIPSEVLVAIGIELASALAFAHNHGIIHRDIKPENVMVRRDGVVKLMDFGVARVLDEGQITLDGSLLGSPAYMSPQQAVDEKLDGRSDLFSLGTVLFHSVTGHVPFAGTNASIILRNIIDGQRAEVLELNPQAAPALAAVIDKLLQTRVEDRYATAEEVEAALGLVLAESGLTLENPRVNLRAWLVNPKEVEGALVAHLETDLLARGKLRLAEGDTVGALQLFNRLLAMNEDHAEVLALIQSLHAPPARRGRIGALAIGAAIALFGAGVGAWALYPRSPPSKPVAALVLPAPPPVPLDPPREEATSPTEPGREPSSESASAAIPSPAHIPGSKLSLPRPAALAAAEPLVAAPARVFWLDMTYPAEVYLDGKHVGSFRHGKPNTWVGTETNPILVQPGEHELKLQNSGSEGDWTHRFTVSAGESHPVKPEFRPIRTEITINPRMPTDCLVIVGGTPYNTIKAMGATFQKPDDPDARLVFDCGKLGRFDFEIPDSSGRGQTIIPERMPVALLDVEAPKP